MSLLKNIIYSALFLSLVFAAESHASLYGFSHANPYEEDELLLGMKNPPKYIPNYRKEMRGNIEALSAYAKERREDFLILIHGGEEVLGKGIWEYNLEGYNEVIRKKINAEDSSFLKKDELLPEVYTKAVDGIVKNNVFCGNTLLESSLLESHLQIISIDHCLNGKAYDNAIEKSIEAGIPLYGFIKEDAAFKKIIGEPIIREDAKNIFKFQDAQNVNFLIDDILYTDKQHMVDDIAKSNYDIVVINPMFHDKEPFTKDDIAQMRFKKNGAKRILLAMQNISEASPRNYFWKKKWQIGKPSWLRRASFSSNDLIIVEYWNNDWKKIMSHYFKSIVDTGYDGAFLTGIENHNYFEKLTPLE